MQTVKNSHVLNYQISLSDQFSNWMLYQLSRQLVRVLRIHVGGDFYSAEYTQKWHTVAKKARSVIFFAYTRSWRDDVIFPELVRLGQLPNVTLWWSTDRETGPAPLIRGIRTAYLAVNDADAASAPDDVDLVFRDRPATVMKKTPTGVQVCPAEACIPGDFQFTCTNCRICWNTGTPQWIKVLGPGFRHAREILFQGPIPATETPVSPVLTG